MYSKRSPPTVPAGMELPNISMPGMCGIAPSTGMSRSRRYSSMVGKFAVVMAVSGRMLIEEFSTSWLPRSHPNHSHQLLHGVGALVQRGLLFGGQLDFNDLFNSLRAQFHRNAHIQTLDSVFAFQISGTRKDFLLVFED